MAVCLRKRPAPPAGSTSQQEITVKGPRTSRSASGQEVQQAPEGVRATRTTPRTADCQRHRSGVSGDCTLLESPAPSAAVAAPPGTAETLLVALGTMIEGQAEGPAAAEPEGQTASPRKPLPPVSAADICARAETWDWAAADVPVTPDTRRAAERVSMGLLLCASEAIVLLCKAHHAYISSDSSAFLSKLLTS